MLNLIALLQSLLGHLPASLLAQAEEAGTGEGLMEILDALAEIPVVGLLFSGGPLEAGKKLIILVGSAMALKVILPRLLQSPSRKMERQILALVGQGRYEEAVNIHLKENNLQKALNLCVQNGLWGKAGAIATRMNDHGKAAECYEKAEDFANAGRSWGKAGKGRQAAEAYARSPEVALWKKAASIFKTEGEMNRAAELFERAGQVEMAAELFANSTEVKDKERAGRLYERLLRDLPEEIPPENTEQLIFRDEILKRAVNNYKSAGKDEEAARLLSDFGRHGEAGELFETRLQNLEVAASLFERAGRVDRAAELYIKLGKSQQGHLLLAEDALARGEVVQAAGHYFQAERYKQVVEVLKASGQVLALEAANLEALYLYGSSLERLRQPEEALRVFEGLISLDATYKDGAMRLAALRTVTRALAEPSVMSGGQRPAGVEGPQRESATMSLPVEGRPGQQEHQGVDEGRYEVQGELGRGGMGIVYRAFDRRLKRAVALKVLAQGATSSPIAEQYFQREAQSAASLSHPNIVTVYDVGVFKGRSFITMEFVEGTTMDRVIKERTRLPIFVVLGYFEQMLDALGYSHERKVIHRDIKPGNIMLCENNRIKLMDFGLAKILEDTQKSTIIAGTPLYMPIEQAMGKAMDHRVDIFALGVTVYQLCTGRLPYPEGIRCAPSDHRPPSPRALKPNIPKVVDRLIMWCIERDREKRPANTGLVLREVQTVLQAARRMGPA